MVWAVTRSLATTKVIVITFFSFRYLDVSVPWVPLITLCIRVMILCLQHSAFPHSDIHGSQFIYNSPWLIAVSHVIHRRLVPRHPLYALCSLIVFFPSINVLWQITNLKLKNNIDAITLRICILNMQLSLFYIYIRKWRNPLLYRHLCKFFYTNSRWMHDKDTTLSNFCQRFFKTFF